MEAEMGFLMAGQALVSPKIVIVSHGSAGARQDYI
jgi:hypothetical protein